MKGVVFNIFEAFVVEHHGEDVFEEILDECNLITKEPFIGPSTYPDEDLLEIVGKTIAKLGISLEDALKVFGKYLFGKLDESHPDFVNSQDNLKDFLKSVDQVIHVEVRKMLPDALTPEFQYEESADNQLTIHYSSPRQMCFLMEGLLEGAAERFSETISQKQTRCTHKGGDRCTFDIRFGA